MRVRNALRWISLVLCIVTASSALVKAQGITNGEYYQDDLTLVLGNKKARITYMGPRCIADFTGRVTRHSDRIILSDPNTEVAPGCIVTLTQNSSGSVTIEQGLGCLAYHGAACSLSGEVQPLHLNEDL